MSPERLDVESEAQIKRRDKQMDVWALGCVSYMVGRQALHLYSSLQIS
jgi:hypothetical protein